MTGRDRRLATEPQAASIDEFLDRVQRMPTPRPERNGGRLVFALDATASRQATWDLAVTLQGSMFDTAANLGGLDVQLVYFRGVAECRASRFMADGRGLARAMRSITVAGGRTQIGRVLTHVRGENRQTRGAALVFVGDAFEERLDPLLGTAGELALLGTKAFMFQEGGDRGATAAFKAIAQVTGGAYAPFDSHAPDTLAALLAAAAAYAAGGMAAMRAVIERQGQGAAGLLSQFR